MKYIRKNKDGILTECVDQKNFTSEHEAIGGWELVTNKACELACMKNAEIIAIKQAANAEAGKAARVAIKATKAEVNTELEAFKAWKASQET